MPCAPGLYVLATQRWSSGAPVATTMGNVQIGYMGANVATGELLEADVAEQLMVSAAEQGHPIPNAAMHGSLEQLPGFRDEPAFARVGFGPAGPYHSWLRTAKALLAGAGLAAFRELGFLAGEVMQLGMDYMQVATRGRAPTQYIRDMERTIQEGLALARCRYRTT